MAHVDRTPAPAHLWLVGIISLLWNAFGAFDYIMTALRDRAYLASVGFGEAEIAYVDSFPAWLVAAWAIGVWASVAGSILLLVRSRHAAAMFAISAAGSIVSFVYQRASDPPASLDSGLPLIMSIVILILIAVQYAYARRMTAAGVLR